MSNGAAKVVINEQTKNAAAELVKEIDKFDKALGAGKVSEDLADDALFADLDALPGLLRALKFYRRVNRGK